MAALPTFSPSHFPTYSYSFFHFSLLTCSHAQYNDGDGSPEFPYEIAEPNQLIYMSLHPEDWDKHFLLTADLNLNLAEPNTFTTALIAPDTDNSTPRFQGTPFTGVFVGNLYTIFNPNSQVG